GAPRLRHPRRHRALLCRHLPRQRAQEWAPAGGARPRRRWRRHRRSRTNDRGVGRRRPVVRARAVRAAAPPRRRGRARVSPLLPAADRGLRAMRVTVYDTTLRDGAQREGISLAVEDKLVLIRRLDQLGVDFVEAGWPGSNPKDLELFARARVELTSDHST